MKMLSLEPDTDTRWIYENNHPDYNTPRAKWLREARSRAIASAPNYMIEEARMNDVLKAYTQPAVEAIQRGTEAAPDRDSASGQPTTRPTRAQRRGLDPRTFG